MKYFLILFTTLKLSFGFSQLENKDSAQSMPWVSLHYGYNWTSGDLARKIGPLNNLGLTGGYKTDKNWVWAFDGNFSFGTTIRVPSLISHLLDSYGNITEENGFPGSVEVTARGFNANLSAGKVFSVFSPNANSGIYTHIGLGYVQHKMRVETQDHFIPLLETDYRKGYDRYTSGLNTHQFLGYCFLADNGLVSFYGGFYLQEGFTKNRRELFFDQPDIPVDKSLQMEIQYGFRLGWFVPIYRSKPKDFYFG